VSTSASRKVTFSSTRLAIATNLSRGWVWEGHIDHAFTKTTFSGENIRARLFAPVIDPRIVSWHGNTFGQQWFIEGGKQTTNLASLNKTTLRAFPIPVPPLAERRPIVAKVDELMAVCDELEQSLATEQDRLLEALLLMRWKIRFQRESMHSLSPFQPEVITQLG